MNTFRLVQRTDTKFHVLNSAGGVVGSICVPAAEVPDLLRHWAGGSVQSPPKQKANPMVAAMLKLRPRAMSRGAILRGCL